MIRPRQRAPSVDELSVADCLANHLSPALISQQVTRPGEPPAPTELALAPSDARATVVVVPDDRATVTILAALSHSPIVDFVVKPKDDEDRENDSSGATRRSLVFCGDSHAFSQAAGGKRVRRPSARQQSFDDLAENYTDRFSLLGGRDAPAKKSFASTRKRHRGRFVSNATLAKMAAREEAERLKKRQSIVLEHDSKS